MTNGWGGAPSAQGDWNAQSSWNDTTQEDKNEQNKFSNMMNGQFNNPLDQPKVLEIKEEANTPKIGPPGTNLKIYNIKKALTKKEITEALEKYGNSDTCKHKSRP